MNFCINLFIALCLISRLGAIEMELKNSTYVNFSEEKNCQVSDAEVSNPFSQKNAKQPLIDKITIQSMQKERAIWVIGEIVIKSKATGNQTSFIIVNCSQKNIDEAKQFIIDVCNALEEINNVSVGRMLLKDICQANTGPPSLIIFNTELFEKLLNTNEISANG